MAAAKRAARISRSVNTAWGQRERVRKMRIRQRNQVPERWGWGVRGPGGAHVQGRCGQQHVGGLEHVSRVQAVVVGHIGVVVVL